MSYLELRDISKIYGEGAAEVHALQRVDLSVDAGSLVAVMGASGSGKSTLLTIAGSLEDPTSGEVYVGGRALSSLSRNGKAQLRRQSIGYVFQDYNLLAGLSAVENVSLPLELDGVAARKAQSAALESLEDFGLKDRASHYPDQLSGGERQRVAIARAVVGGPAAAPGRRALRRARLHQRRGGHAPDPGGLPPRHGRRRGDPRRPARLVGRPRDLPPRRPDRRPDAPGREPGSGTRRPPEPMSVGVLERPATGSAPEPTTGGVPARRAMIRWAWRLFKREWRQQLLILLLVIVAVAAVVVGAAVAVNTPPPANAGFGTADDMATFASSNAKQAHLDLQSADAQIAALEHRFGTVQVIENETFHVPGSTQTYQLRSQDPHGPYGGPMLQLLSGHYPDRAGPDRPHPGAGVRAQPAGGRHLVPGRQDRRRHRAEPPEPARRVRAGSPGAGDAPDPGDVLFDAPGVNPGRIGANVYTPAQNGNSNPINPDTIVLALATVGMLLIALVSVGGFTVLAQRRLRALGMLESMGATDRNVRLVLRANGVIVGAVGALVGFALGLVAWLAYRPHNEQSAHHLIPMFALPWTVIVVAMVLAVVATFLAAGHPARAITRVPVVSALAGRPAPPRQIHRSFVPGVIALVIGFFMFSASGAAGSSGVIWLIPGFVALVAGIILMAPFFLALLARVGRRAPIAIRLALRDLSRYRARSGSALSAISVGVLIAVVICAVAVARYSNVYDYVGPNLASNELAVWSPNGQNGNNPDPSAPTLQDIESQEASVHSIASAVGATDVVELDNPAPSVGLQNPSASGRQWDGQIFVATPALLRAYGINPSSIPSDVDVLSSRPGLSGSGVQLTYGGGGGKGGGQLVGPGSGGGGGPGPGNTNTCSPGGCIAHPVVQEESRLPTGTDAPNTVITESALRRLHLASQSSLDGWIIQANSPITSAQITNAQALAATNNLSIESKNDAPTSHEIVNWATVFAIALGSRHPGHEHRPHPQRDGERVAHADGHRRQLPHPAHPDGGHRRRPGLPGRAARDGGRLRRAGRVVPLERPGRWPVGHHRSHPLEQPVPHRDRHARRRHDRRLGVGGTGPDGDLHPPDGVARPMQ